VRCRTNYLILLRYCQKKEEVWIRRPVSTKSTTGTLFKMTVELTLLTLLSLSSIPSLDIGVLHVRMYHPCLRVIGPRCMVPAVCFAFAPKPRSASSALNVYVKEAQLWFDSVCSFISS
jgi:hypothetical protein